jgi:argininosuccinate synthase
MGIKDEHIFIDDLREEFVRDFVFPMMRANALYEGSICSARRSRGR